MTAQHVLQIAVACIAVGTPWIVVRLALGIASAHASAVGVPMTPPPAVARLTRATLVVLPLVTACGWLLAPPSLLMGALDVGAFILLSFIGFPALQRIDQESAPARTVKSAERLASLRPRRLDQYLPLPMRLLPFIVTGLGVILLGWRLTTPMTDRLLVPVAFILSAPIFVWLYEVCMRADVSGGEVIGVDESAADGSRRRRVRKIFAIELTLALGLMTAGHTLLGSDWSRDGAWVALASLAGAVLGVLGCAFAVSSELGRRRYLRHDALR